MGEREKGDFCGSQTRKNMSEMAKKEGAEAEVEKVD